MSDLDILTTEMKHMVEAIGLVNRDLKTFSAEIVTLRIAVASMRTKVKLIGLAAGVICMYVLGIDISDFVN